MNEFRAGFNRFRLDYTADQFEPGAQLGNQLGVPNANVTPNEQNLPIFSPSNYIGIGQTRSLPIFRRENTFQYVDNVSYTHGQHTLKWGVDFRRRQLTIYQTNQGNGRFNFSPALTDSRQPAGSGGDSMASFLLGYPTLIAHDYTLNWPGERGIEIGTYFADDWRITQQAHPQPRPALGLLQPVQRGGQSLGELQRHDREDRHRRPQRSGQVRRREAVLQELRTALRLRLLRCSRTR